MQWFKIIVLIICFDLLCLNYMGILLVTLYLYLVPTLFKRRDPLNGKKEML